MMRCNVVLACLLPFLLLLTTMMSPCTLDARVDLMNEL